MKRFIRTKGGSIWELGKDGCYHKPNVANCISATDTSIVATSDEMYKLVKVGDLVRYKHQDLKVREVVEKDTITGENFAKHWNFDAIYIPVVENGIVRTYSLEAAIIAGHWCAM